MIKILKPTPVNIDGCAVGVSAEDGAPTYHEALAHPSAF